MIEVNTATDKVSVKYSFSLSKRTTTKSSSIILYLDSTVATEEEPKSVQQLAATHETAATVL